MARKIMLVFIVVFTLFSMVGCGSSKAQDEVETTTDSKVETATESEVETTENTDPTDPSYYRNEYSETMSKFWSLCSEMHFCKSEAFEGFISNPKITEDFLVDLESANNLYMELVDLYYETRFGKHEDVSVKEYCTMENEIECEYIEKPMVTIEENGWVHGSNRCKYDTEEMNWKHIYSCRYSNGLFEISDHYYATVDWFENLEAYQNPKDVEVKREFRVVDPSKDAYLLINGIETGYRLVVIKAVK